MTRRWWWPWVSYRAYEVLGEQLAREAARADRLEQRVAELVDQVARLARTTNGLPERTPQVKTVEPMPESIRLGIDAWDDPKVRRDLRAKAYARYQQTGSWERVANEMEAV